MADSSGGPRSGLLTQPLQEVLDAVAAHTPAPGAGAVSAVVAALAAALTAMSARFAGQDEAATDLADRADTLRGLVAVLADADVAAYGTFLASRSQDGQATEAAARAALDEATRIPLAIAEIALEVAEMAGRLARSGNRRLRGDATTAVLLSAAAATSAAVLVAENMADRPDDPRLDSAAGYVVAARAAAADAVDMYPPLQAG